jgi:hypothetical protein
LERGITKAILALLASLFLIALPAAGAEKSDFIRIMAGDPGYGPFEEICP